MVEMQNWEFTVFLEEIDGHDVKEEYSLVGRPERWVEARLRSTPHACRL